MERRAFLIYSGSLAALLLAGCAGQSSRQGGNASGTGFSEAERALIVGFYEQQGARTPGREKPAQRVKAGDKLDPGQSPNRLPDELSRKLPDLPDPYTRLTLGGDVILVNRNTHDILDVVPQVAY